MPADVHRYKDGNGIHTKNSPLGKDWNAVWDDFITNNPKATSAEVLKKLRQMEKKAGIGQYKAKKKK